jgi:hypothetical protein
MRKLVVVLFALAALVAPAAAAAHPLGNFTVNRFSRVEVSGPRLYVRYVLDLAEIPTYQAGRIDAGTYAREIAQKARLSVGGKAAALRPVRTRLAHPRGAGGLDTTRLEVVLAGPRLDGTSRIAYRDGNYRDRIGWKEIVVGADTPSRSHELRTYPKDLLQSPLDQTSVTTDLAPGDGPDVTPSVSSGRSLQAPDRVADSGFAGLVGRSHLSLLVILASLGARFSGAPPTRSRPGTGRRSSPPTSSAAAAPCAMRGCWG